MFHVHKTGHHGLVGLPPDIILIQEILQSRGSCQRGAFMETGEDRLVQGLGQVGVDLDQSIALLGCRGPLVLTRKLSTTSITPAEVPRAPRSRSLPSPSSMGA